MTGSIPARLRKELANSTADESDFKKAAFFGPGGAMKHGFIQEHREEFNLDEMCECLEVNRGGYYPGQGES